MTTIDEVLPRISVWRGRETTVSELSGGLTNTNYLVDVGRRSVRRADPWCLDGAARRGPSERAPQRAAAASTTGVSPRIVEVLEDVDVMVIEYVEGTTMSSERAAGARDGFRGSPRRSAVCTPGPGSSRTSTCSASPSCYLRVCGERDYRIPEGFR